MNQIGLTALCQGPQYQKLFWNLIMWFKVFELPIVWMAAYFDEEHEKRQFEKSEGDSTKASTAFRLSDQRSSIAFGSIGKESSMSEPINDL